MPHIHLPNSAASLTAALWSLAAQCAAAFRNGPARGYLSKDSESALHRSYGAAQPELRLMETAQGISR